MDVKGANMNKLAFRQKSGDWIYYLSYFTYEEVSLYVKRIDSELHKSQSLNDMIQRSLTDNVQSIASYIQNQSEHFFNALVLAVYDGDPMWREINIDYGQGENYELGVLDFSGEEKIFPVDGQHRVEGIKLVLDKKEGDQYKNETIPVILIGHKKTVEGMQRTRRLFSTLNRYAKPVTLNDIIALDEDDIIAIATRHLIENCVLFQESRLNNHKQKAIPKKDKTAFTNIISLYECNAELLKYFISNKKILINGKEAKGKRKVEEYCRIRPSEEEIEVFINFVDAYWGAFIDNISIISNYLSNSISENPAQEYRHESGGNLLFRPVGQRPFVLAALALYSELKDFDKVMSKMNLLNFNLDSELWLYIAWNPIIKKMITSSNGKLIELIIKYLLGISLTGKELSDLKDNYKALKKNEQWTNEDVIEYLNQYKV